MAKWGKRLLGLAAIGGVVAGLVYYFNNSNSTDDEFCDDFEDTDLDLDLDEDLKPVKDREYVSLHPTSSTDDSAEETADTVHEEPCASADSATEENTEV